MFFKENPILRYFIIYIIIFIIIIALDYIFSSETDLFKAFFGALLVIILSAAFDNNDKRAKER